MGETERLDGTTMELWEFLSDFARHKRTYHVEFGAIIRRTDSTVRALQCLGALSRAGHIKWATVSREVIQVEVRQRLLGSELFQGMGGGR